MKGAGLGSLYSARAALGTTPLDKIDCSTSFIVSPWPTHLVSPVKLLRIYWKFIFSAVLVGERHHGQQTQRQDFPIHLDSDA